MDGADHPHPVGGLLYSWHDVPAAADGLWYRAHHPAAGKDLPDDFFQLFLRPGRGVHRIHPAFLYDPFSHH